MDAKSPTTIESLPPELLFEILGYLDTPPPSETRLHDQPHPYLFKSPQKNLKDASLVSKRWHAIALPILFRHVVWDLDRWELLRVDPAQNGDRDPIDGLPLLAFLRDNNLAHHVDSLAMVMRDSMQGMVAGGARDTSILRAIGREDADEGSSSRTIRVEQIAGPRLPRFASQLATTYNQDCNWVWDMLFEFINPRKFTILASPQLLATMLSTRIYLQDAWSFSRTTIHALSLSRDTKAHNEINTSSSNTPSSEIKEPIQVPDELLSEVTGGVSSEVLKRPPTKLFTVRPWTHLLLNEGSSTRVYKTYEFFHRRPPSILGSLLGADRKNSSLIPPTLTSLAYVAVFPLSSHFNTLVNNLPRLDRLFVQLVPRDNILRDPDEMRNVQPSDLWMERNSCYSLIMRELLSGDLPGHDDDSDFSGDDDIAEPGTDAGGKENNWRHLREFESGDAADKEAWDMAVQFVCMSGTHWHVEREGVFVKGARNAPSDSLSNSDGEEETASSPFHGQLERLSFNGTARLPFSPMSGSIDSYVFAAELPWVYTNADTMEVDFFALLQDVTGFGGTGTIGDLAELGYLGDPMHMDSDGDDYDDDDDDDDLPPLVPLSDPGDLDHITAADNDGYDDDDLPSLHPLNDADDLDHGVGADDVGLGEQLGPRPEFDTANSRMDHAEHWWEDDDSFDGPLAMPSDEASELWGEWALESMDMFLGN